MLKYSDVSTARSKYSDHPLFFKCIEIWCPKGWMDYLDKVVSFIENYNKNCLEQDRLAFAQVKIKWDRLTIYLEPLFDSSKEWSKSAQKAGVYDYIKTVINDASNHCTFCGNELIEMVIDSRIKAVCMDHFPQSRHGKS